MEALALEGVLLQKALNEGRKLLREKVDLEAQVKNLSDILAEKDHRIMDLEAEVEMLRENNKESVSRCVDFFNINDFDTTYYRRDDEDIPKLDIRHEMDEINNMICAMTLAGASNEEIRNIVMYSMVVIDCKKLKLDWQKAKADFHVQELKDRYFPFYQHEKHTV